MMLLAVFGQSACRGRGHTHLEGLPPQKKNFNLSPSDPLPSFLQPVNRGSSALGFRSSGFRAGVPLDLNDQSMTNLAVGSVDTKSWVALGGGNS